MFIFVSIILLLFLVYGLLIDYYRRAWTGIPSPPPIDPQSVPATSISVIIPARNEEANIIACLDSLYRQSYPRTLYQVIVIDDQSADKTWQLLQNSRHPGMDRLNLSLASYLKADEKISAHKKFAIETGISAASGSLIITTDADCLFHPDWLRTIAGFYERTGARFIAAPVRIAADRSSLLGIFQALDFIALQGITGASVYKRFHSMCNGANLAYSKDAFYEVEGFRDIDQIPSGDDMLLMHKIYTKYPEQVFFLKDKKAIVDTRPETRWRGFLNQRIRWASKADKYDDKRIFSVLLLVYVLNFLFIVLLFLSLINPWWLLFTLVLLLFKTLTEYPFVRRVASFFDQQRLCLYFPLLQPFHIVYTVVVGWLGKFGSYRWKDRTINK